MIKLTSEQFEELKRLQSPEVFTEAQMGAWVEGLKDTLVKAEVDELDATEKAVVDEFNREFASFVKVQVISTPSESELSKGLKYDNFFIREKQVEWTDEIQKSEDGGEDKVIGRTGVYLDTKLNRDMNRVGLAFGGSTEGKVGEPGELKKSEEDDIEKGGEGSKGGKIIGHTKSGKPIYARGEWSPKGHSQYHLKKEGDRLHKEWTENHKDFTSEEHREAAAQLHKKGKENNNTDLITEASNHATEATYKERQSKN